MWRWRWTGGGSRPFESKEDAEAWLGDEWSSLGAEEVELVHDDELVYRMSLEEE